MNGGIFLVVSSGLVGGSFPISHPEMIGKLWDGSDQFQSTGKLGFSARSSFFKLEIFFRHSRGGTRAFGCIEDMEQQSQNQH